MNLKMILRSLPCFALMSSGRERSNRMKQKLILTLVLAWAAAGGSAWARLVPPWPEAQVSGFSDLIVIAQPIANKDLNETNSLGFGRPNAPWSRFRGVETTFKVRKVLKGKLEETLADADPRGLQAPAESLHPRHAVRPDRGWLANLPWRFCDARVFRVSGGSMHCLRVRPRRHNAAEGPSPLISSWRRWRKPPILGRPLKRKRVSTRR